MDISRLSKQVSALVKDLEQRLGEDAALAQSICEAWQDANAHERTSATLTEWREEYLTQVAVAWVLTLVFVRYLEDHGFIEPVLFGELAQQRQRAHFQQEQHKVDSDADYLLHLFAQLSNHHAGQLFSAKLNPLHKLTISAEAATKLIKHFREADAETGDPVLDLRGQDTRFLGDLYQDLSEDIRKKYALLQTPDFAEDFILDMTLEPAIEVFGLDQVRFIDPTCGSGHFVLGGFKRIFQQKREQRPTERADVLVREALEASFGVDINPFAVAIARFRLLIEAFRLAGVTRWDDQHDWPLNLATGDSLLLGKHFPRFETCTTTYQSQLELDQHRWSHLYSTEDNDLIFGDQDRPGILMQQYHAVVGNPPYITVKDAGPREAYKKHYSSAYMQYSLVTPFYERFFELAIGAELNEEQQQLTLGGGVKREVTAGFVGMIVGNAFMKRSFGKRLIEQIVPKTDLTHVIDTSGAYIPGHGTPTVILVGRNQLPKSETVRAVLGIRGEPSTPEIPREGLVWTSIVEHINQAGFDNDFISVDDSDRTLFGSHPWSLQGGGALDLQAAIDGSTSTTLGDIATEIGFGVVTREDDVFLLGQKVYKRFNIENTKPLIAGENARDWALQSYVEAFWPYNDEFKAEASQGALRYLFPFKSRLSKRVAYGLSQIERGLAWFEYSMFFDKRYRIPLTITYAFVATHNHFVLDRGGKVFNRTAPVIKLPADATVDDHLGLLGLLNSSTFAFWGRSIFFQKGGAAEQWEDRLEYDCTKMQEAPIPDERPLELARKLDELAQQASELEPSALAAREVPSIAALEQAKAAQAEVMGLMIALQEELDWRSYELYGLLDAGDAPLMDAAQLEQAPRLALGQRAFEIVLARKVAEGDAETTWFERHSSTPITELPEDWPDWYKEIVQRRIELIEQKRFIRLIEQPVYKRRWSLDAWEDREKAALKSWMLDRLESARYVPQADREDSFAQQQPRLMSVKELVTEAELDEAFVQVAARYTGQPHVEVGPLIKTLVMEEAAPFLPTQRYKPSGLERRKEWEQVWRLQRLEDAIDARAQLEPGAQGYLTQEQAEALKAEQVGALGAPPSYTSKDFVSNAVYSLRGKLDVPKERFIWYQGCDGEDGWPVVAWAGLDHKQQALALAAYYHTASQVFGFEPERLLLLLAGLQDLLPWLEQWHNALDPLTGVRFGEFLRGFVAREAVALGSDLEAVERARIGA